MKVIPRWLCCGFLALAMSAAVGCGNKGELFLPESQPPEQADESDEEESSR